MPAEEDALDESVVLDESESEVIDVTYSITSYGADFTTETLFSKLENGSVYIPSFQRKYVWTIEQASRFIESLLIGLPVPGIFLSREDSTNRLLIIDGQQRLKTIQFFVKGVFEPSDRPFTLKGVTERLSNRRYVDLDEPDKLAFNDSIIHATIVHQDEPDDGNSSIYSIFERLNTGGTLLTAQEIRTCIYHGSFVGFLNELNQNLAWRKVYGAKSKRMKDQELILRFLAMQFSLDEYKKPLKGFLNVFIERYRNITGELKSSFEAAFVRPIQFISENLERKAFRQGSQINAAIFDSVMLGVAERLNKGAIENREAFRKEYQDLLEDPHYKVLVSKGTSDEKSVRERISMAVRAFRELG